MEKEIIRLLQEFQTGYKRKDIGHIDDFVNNLFMEDAVCLGTSANEFCIGHKEILNLTKYDWQYWGSIEIDFSNAQIVSFGETAGFVAPGVLDWFIPNDLFLGKTISDVNALLNNKEDLKSTLMQINNLSSKMLLEAERGETHLLPIRISAVLRLCSNNWKFAQLVISHPTEKYPDSRM